MAWISIDTDDVKTRLAGAEVEALQTAALASGQSDPLPEIVQQVVDEVRGYVAANSSNTLGAGATIPSKLLGAALAIIRYRLATRLPVSGLLTDERIRENDAAIRLLEQVARGQFAVEEPVTEDTETSPSSGPSITGKTRYFDADGQYGL